MWSLDNGLVLNCSKTIAICIGSNKVQKKAMDKISNNISLNGTVIDFVDCVRNLGLFLDKNLNFENHVTKKISIAYSKLKTIYKFRNLIPCTMKWKLVNSLVITHTDYCSSVYYPFLTNQFQNKLQVLQNNAFKFSYFVPHGVHITPYYNEQELLKINSRWKYMFLNFLYKIIKYKTPNYLFELIHFRSQEHQLSIRYNTITIPLHKTVKYEGSFAYQVAKMYNCYKQYFEEKGSQISFKKTLFKRLIDDQINAFM